MLGSRAFVFVRLAVEFLHDSSSFLFNNSAYADEDSDIAISFLESLENPKLVSAVFNLLASEYAKLSEVLG